MKPMRDYAEVRCPVRIVLSSPRIVKFAVHQTNSNTRNMIPRRLRMSCSIRAQRICFLVVSRLAIAHEVAFRGRAQAKVEALGVLGNNTDWATPSAQTRRRTRCLLSTKLLIEICAAVRPCQCAHWAARHREEASPIISNACPVERHRRAWTATAATQA